ncbi:MAG: hypothetical protein A3E79_13610 [Burkholderiales bacterium RIFCSPHIGHO2_12_FULL_61_11]|nr:MAG: hypothetical protein A3E79_13610 [Burkholderiales bacterium RIFCSPHIGHO2_12_FULL_61_11]
MSKPILNAPTPNQHKLDILRQHFPQAVEVDAQGRVRINAAGLQLAIDPSNPAGLQVEEDGYELRWVGKREAYHSAFVPVQKIIEPLPLESKNWDSTGNVLIKGDNLDALRLLRHSYFGKVKLIYIDPPYNTQSDAFVYRDDFSAKQSEVLAQLGYSADNIDYIKNIYGFMPVDSKIERDTVDESNQAQITVFAKLPKIDIPTPAGKYNPDFGYAIHQGGSAQALYLVVETKGYDNYADIPTKEKWKIDSARKFFKALQELPDLKEKGVQIHYQSKINGESLAQLISSIK